MSKTFLVTGGAGFIGSAVVRYAIRKTDFRVVVVDKLTYAGNLESLAPVSNDPRYSFVRADITDAPKMPIYWKRTDLMSLCILQLKATSTAPSMALGISF